MWATTLLSLTFLYNLILTTEALNGFRQASSVVLQGQSSRSGRERRGTKLNPKGANVCRFKGTKTIYSTETLTVTTIRSQKVCCSNWIRCWKYCDRPQVLKKKITATVSKLVDVDVYHCCTGYSVDESGVACAKPICNPYCRNAGSCQAPNVCKCAQGFTGRFCQNDVDECKVPEKTGCTQLCINLPGTYSCACKRGFVPKDPESKTCDNIDECVHNPCKCIGKGCRARCYNTEGSYVCKCEKGYRLSRWNLCTDRNECQEQPNLCKQRCINVPGSYKCECWPGFAWNGKTCEEVNECSIGNGGCEHNCHNVFGGHVCSCKAGFYLASDRYGCIDFNECNGITECDAASSICVNTDGDYYCNCRHGFKYSNNNRTCEDRDECKEKTDLCDQKCANNFGSYSCSCSAGYELKSDKRTCEDIDECKRNVCAQRCVNVVGSFYCACHPGYILDADRKSCKPQLCERNFSPFYGEIDCNGDSLGKVCNASCQSGYYLTGEKSRTCLASGKWSGKPPSCIPNNCAQPVPPANGKVTLPCEVSFGSTCPVTCPWGFVRRGNPIIQCVMEKGKLKWNVDTVKCEEILVCKPNPCQHGGKCKIVSPIEHRCNCSKTGYEGPNCNIGILSFKSFPKMLVNVKSPSFTLIAKPTKSLSIEIVPSHPEVEIIPQNKLKISAPQTSVTFSLMSKRAGFISLAFYLSSSDTFKKPNDAQVFIYDQDKAGVKIKDLVFGKTCHELNLQTNRPGCPNVKLYSTSFWKSRSNGMPYSEGVALVDVGPAKLPIFMTGADPSVTFSSISNILYSFGKQNSNSHCSSRKLSFAEQQYIAKHDVFTKTFFKEFNKLSPSWFRIGLNGELSSFDHNSISAFLWPGATVKASKACSNLAIDEQSFFVVYLHKQYISLQVQDKSIVMESDGIFCLAVDICTSESHLGVPDDNVQQLQNLLSLHDLNSLGWTVNAKSVGFSGKPRPPSSIKCQTTDASSLKKVLLGTSDISFHDKKSFVSANIKGDMYLHTKKDGKKEIISSIPSCMMGSSKVKAKNWFASDRPLNQYEKVKYDRKLSFHSAEKSSKEENLVFTQHEKSVFKMISGISPILIKDQDPLKVGFKYKETKSTSSGSSNDNFEKISLIETLYFPVSDLEMEIAGVMNIPAVAKKLFYTMQSTISSWSSMLLNDQLELGMDSSNTKLINDKFSVHYYKGEFVTRDLKKLKAAFVQSSGSATFIQKLTTSIKDLESTLDDMKKKLIVKSGPKKFTGIFVSFSGRVCVLKPCLENVNVTLFSVKNEPGSKEFFPDRGPFEIWKTKGVFNKDQKSGLFFYFNKGSEVRFYLDQDGARKTTFLPVISLFGYNFTEELFIQGTTIKPKDRKIPLIGKFNFDIRYSIDTQFKRWDMLKIPVSGAANDNSDFIVTLQTRIHNYVRDQYFKLKTKVDTARKSIDELQQEENFLRGRLQSDQLSFNRARVRYGTAKATYEKSKVDNAANRKVFVKDRNALLQIEVRLNKECPLIKCPDVCVKVDNCDVCQKPVYLNKTFPSCVEKTEDRSYEYVKTYLGRCSHMVQDRTLKYTGNCPKPRIEPKMAEDIMKRINKKIKNNQTLDIEDALNLQLIDEKAGKKLQNALEKATFFKRMPELVQLGLMIESDFEKLAQYTNKTFADKIREQQKSVVRAKVLIEISQKLNRSEKITEEDLKRVERVDPELAKTLRKNQVISEIEEKLKRGESLTKADVSNLKAIDPKLATNVTTDLIKQLKDRQLMQQIQEKIGSGQLLPSDIKKLEASNPDMANKLKEALKKQLKKKVEEMEKKLKNVRNTIRFGTNGTDFTSLEDQLQRLAKTTKPIDEASLQKIQNRLSQWNQGSPFENVFNRFDLDLEVLNVTGVSKHLEKITNLFSSILSKFDLPKILQGSEKWILSRLEDIQEWFKTAAKLIKRLCKDCSSSCDSNDSVDKVLTPIKIALSRFITDVCERKWKVGFKFGKIFNTCKEVKDVKKFLDLTKYKSKHCRELNTKVVKPLEKIAELWKTIRAEVPTTFKEQWQQAEQTKKSLGNYVSFTTDLTAALRTVSTSVKLKVKPTNEILQSVEKIVRTGKHTVKLVEVENVLAVLKETEAVLKMVPTELKRLSGSTVSLKISEKEKQKLKSRMGTLLSDALNAIVSICNDQQVLTIQDRIDGDTAKKSAGKIFDEFLSGGLVSKVYTKAQHAASLLKQYRELLEKQYLKLRECVVKKYVSPVASLAKQLNEVKPFVTKSYKDLLNDVRNNLKEVGRNIAIPIGKVVDSIRSLVSGVPKFDVPLFLFINPRDSQLALNALHEYISISANSLKGMADIVKKCPQCLPRDVFGNKGLKEVTESLDKALKPISRDIRTFTSKMVFSPPGLSLVVTSLERTRTSLQRIYKSGTAAHSEHLTDTVSSLEATALSVKGLIKGYINTYKAFVTTKNKDIKEFVTSVGELVIVLRQTNEQLQGSGKELKNIYSDAYSLYNSLREIPKSIDVLSTGPISQRLKFIRDTQKLLGNVPSVVASLYKRGQKVLPTDDLQNLGLKINAVAKNFDDLMSKSISLLEHLNLGTIGFDSKRSLGSVPFKKMLTDVGQASNQARPKSLSNLDSVVKKASVYNKGVQEKASGLFSSVAGTVDQIKEKVHRLREKVDSYKDVYNDFMATFDLIKKGPLSEIGRIKDSAASFAESVGQYDFRKMLNSDPNVLARKLGEFKQLISLTGTSLGEIDRFLQKCKKCNVKSIFGYSFVRDLIKDVSHGFNGIYLDVEKFAQKVGDATGEFHNISKTLKRMKSRFDNIQEVNRDDLNVFRNLSDSFMESHIDIDLLQQGSTKLAKIILGEDVDLSVTWATMDSLVNHFEKALNKSASITAGIQKTQEKIRKLKSDYHSLRAKVKTLEGGPSKVRIDIAKDISDDVKGLVNSLPDLFSTSSDVLAKLGIDEKWLDKVGEKIEALVGSLGQVMKRTDRIVEATGVVIKGVDDIQDDLPKVASAFKQISKAPLKDKIKELRNAASSVGAVMDKAVGITLKTASALNIDLTKEDLIETAKSLVGEQRINNFVQMFTNISLVLVDLEKGPVADIGKLTDSVDAFVDGIKGYDLGKALLTDPASLKEKVAQFQQLSSATADILVNISQITGLCTKCSLERILGKKFTNKMSNAIGIKFREISDDMNAIYKRVKIGYKGWTGFVNTAKSISDAFSDAKLGKGEITPETFQRTSEALRKSAVNLQSVKNASSDIFKALFDEKSDLKGLQEKFNGLVDEVSVFMKKGAVVSDKVEDAFETGKKIKELYESVSKNVDNSKEGPVEARVKIVRQIIKGTNQLIAGLPDVINKTAGAAGALGVNGTWLRNFGNNLATFSEKVDQVVNKTDSVLHSVSLAIPSISNISRLSQGMKKDFDSILDAPWEQKFDIFNGALKKMGGILSNVNGVAVVTNNLLKTLNDKDYNISSGVLNMTTGITGALGNLSSAVSYVQGVFKDVSSTIDAIKSGPVSKIGKLTDSIETFVDSIKNYDLREVLLLSPKFAKEKLGEIKEIIKESGVIMGNISDVVSKVCPSCKFDELFGGKFVNVTTTGIEKALDKVLSNSSVFLDKLTDSAENINEVIGSVNGIKNSIQRLKLVKFNSDGFKTVSNILTNSSDYLDSIKNSSGNVFDVLFGKDQDMMILKGKFEGFVTNMGSFLDKAGDLSDKASEAMEKVEAVTATFNNVKGNFNNVSKGPLANRVEAVQNMVKGISSIMSGLPDIFKKASLGLDSTAFLRRMGTQLDGVTNGIQQVLNKTNLVLNDVGSVISGIDGISQTSKIIGSDFQKILRAPWSKKFDIALGTVKKVNTLTNQINNLTDDANNIFQALSGKTLFKTSIFGNGTAVILGKISDGITLLADRYEKFRGLTKTIGEAFNNISADPIGFALEGLPKLFEESEKFITTLVEDSQGIMNKIGIDVEGLSLSPELVAGVKNFYSFAKSTLGTIQNGKTLISDFKNLFESKNFQDAMVNLQKVSKSGPEFMQNLDSLGTYLFKDDWKDIKGDFSDAVDSVGESLGLDMEKVGEWFSNGLDTISGLFSIKTNLEDLFSMKKFDVRTVAKATEKVMSIAKTSVSLLNKFGANIQTATLNKIASGVTIVASVVQIVVGVKDFIKWMNDVCDITYKTVVINKNISYVCVKNQIAKEEIKVPVPVCKYVEQKVQKGFGTSELCCTGKECVTMQEVSCLQRNQVCFEKRKKILPKIYNLQKNLILAYEALEESRLTMETALIDMKSAQYLIRRAGLALNVTVAELRQVRIQKTRTRKIYDQSNGALIKLSPIVDKLHNKSFITVQRASFQMTLHDPAVTAIPLKIEVLGQSRKPFEVNIVANRSNEKDSMNLITRKIFMSVTDFIPRRKRRDINGFPGDKKLKKWVARCSELNDDVNLLRTLLKKLSDDISKASEKAVVVPTSKMLVKSSNPMAATTNLKAQVDALKNSLKQDIVQVLRQWKKFAMALIIDQGDMKCTNYDECVSSFVDEMSDQFEPIMESYNYVRLTLSNVKLLLKKVGTSISQKSLLVQHISQIDNLIGNVLNDAEFCDTLPTFKVKKPTRRIAYLGEKFTLECRVRSRSKVTFTWKKNGTEISSQQGVSFTIENVNKDDQGSYVCEASNLVGTSYSGAVLVLVAKRPRLVSQPKDFAFFSHSKATAQFYCNVSGEGDIQYKWKFLSFVKHSVAVVRGNQAELEIRKPSKYNVGYYWCEATDGESILISRKAKLSLLRKSPIFQVARFNVWLQVVKTTQKNCEFFLSDTTYNGAIKNVMEDFLRKSLRLIKGQSSLEIRVVGNSLSNNVGKVQITVGFGGASEITGDAGLAMSASKRQQGLKDKLTSFIAKIKKTTETISVKECILQVLTEMNNEIDFTVTNRACPRGMAPDESRTSCVECVEGTHDIGTGECVPCIPGTYQNTPGSHYCKSCGMNLLTSLSASGSPSLCSLTDFSCNSSLKVLLALDSGKGLTTTERTNIKKFAEALLSTLHPSVIANGVSLAHFGTAATVDAIFGDASLKKLKVSSTEDEKQSGGDSRLDLVLRLATGMFKRSFSHEDQRKILVIVGKSPPVIDDSSSTELRKLSDILKSVGVKVFYASVGSSIDAANLVVSKPAAKFLVNMEDSSKLSTFATSISYQMCRGI